MDSRGYPESNVQFIIPPPDRVSMLENILEMWARIYMACAFLAIGTVAVLAPIWVAELAVSIVLRFFHLCSQ